MRKVLFSLLILSLALNIYATDISFSGGKSSLSLREGKEEVILSEGAIVTIDDMTIKGDKIILSGTDWRYVECEGTTEISDKSRGLDIKAVGIWYDRESENLLIESWFEINDTEEGLFAMGGSMVFDMNQEILELSQQVTLQKITDSGIMRCSAESMIYDRDGKTLTLRSGATVDWDGDIYKAEVIQVNLENDSIKLEGRIEGNING